VDLSPEDNLKLNVLLSQNLQAVRIDDSKMVVHALTSKGEARIELNPTLRDDQYVRQVREFFSTHALGSPGGYPVYLKRWTRMGQAREDKLDSLLILGEPEAVVAVAHAPGLTEELARRTWWAMPTAEVARKLLANAQVARSAIGGELAGFLLEYLPFETEAAHIIESITRILTPGLLERETILALWKRAGRKSAYYVGFINAIPDDLPEPGVERADHGQLCSAVPESGPMAQMLRHLSSAAGQQLLLTINQAMHKASDQDMVVELLKSIERYFLPVRPATEAVVFNCSEQIDVFVTQPSSVPQDLAPWGQQVEAILRLAMVSENLADPVFAQTDAVGSVMRKKLKPVFDWLSVQIGVLSQAEFNHTVA